jgi:hypothetical protein
VVKIFNGLRGAWVPVTGTDEEVSGVAAWDAKQKRLAVVLVNYRDRESLRRRVRLHLPKLPASLQGGRWQESVVDATHSNVWNDPGHAELAVVRTGELARQQAFDLDETLAPNSVTLLELTGR